MPAVHATLAICTVHVIIPWRTARATVLPSPCRLRAGPFGIHPSFVVFPAGNTAGSAFQPRRSVEEASSSYDNQGD